MVVILSDSLFAPEKLETQGPTDCKRGIDISSID